MWPSRTSRLPRAITAGGRATALRKIAARGRLPIVTGGTGLYLRALTEGLFAGPARQEDLRARLRRAPKARKRVAASRAEAAGCDSAERIHANDTPKLIRAIEVCVARAEANVGSDGRDPLTGFRLLRIGLNPPRAARLCAAQPALCGDVCCGAGRRDARIARALSGR